MKSVLVLLTVSIAGSLANAFNPFGSLPLIDKVNPIGQLPLSSMFDPFGRFLQGELLNLNGTGSDITKFANLDSFHTLFKQTLDETSDILDKFFWAFAEKFDKSYDTDEESEKRKGIFRDNLLSVFEHNVKAATGRSSYTQHINQFADMPIDEIVHGVVGQFPAQPYNNTIKISTRANKNGQKDSWIYDWRTVHDVTPVQNQGGCGACVYFAAAALIETAWARHGHGLVVLSPQQLNDCAHDDAKGNHGCQHGGGTFVPTFDYIKAKGLTSMQNYPYLARDADCNRQKEAQTVARISSWTPVTPHGNEEALRQVIEKNGPAAVAIHVSDGWARYKQGIFDEPCSGGRNHAVLAVGYGFDGPSNKDYWIVKNQWGEGFGEQGYIRMRRNNNNMCDIAGDAVWVD